MIVKVIKSFAIPWPVCAVINQIIELTILCSVRMRSKTLVLLLLLIQYVIRLVFVLLCSMPFLVLQSPDWK